MRELSLSESMSNSLKPEVLNVIAELGEIGLDSLMDDGVLKEIPIISTAVSVYKFGNSIRERHNISKLLKFLQELNNGIADEEQRQKYTEKFSTDPKVKNRELEYIIIILDRYINFDKAKHLAKLYLAYLDDVISWLDFCKYSETIDRFLPGDLDVLKSRKRFSSSSNIPTDVLQRLVANGLIIEERPPSEIKSSNNGTIVFDALSRRKRNEREYTRTAFGNVLVDILDNEIEE